MAIERDFLFLCHNTVLIGDSRNSMAKVIVVVILAGFFASRVGGTLDKPEAQISGEMEVNGEGAEGSCGLDQQKVDEVNQPTVGEQQQGDQQSGPNNNPEPNHDQTEDKEKFYCGPVGTEGSTNDEDVVQQAVVGMKQLTIGEQQLEDQQSGPHNNPELGNDPTEDIGDTDHNIVLTGAEGSTIRSDEQVEEQQLDEHNNQEHYQESAQNEDDFELRSGYRGANDAAVVRQEVDEMKQLTVPEQQEPQLDEHDDPEPSSEWIDIIGDFVLGGEINAENGDKYTGPIDQPEAQGSRPRDEEDLSDRKEQGGDGEESIGLKSGLKLERSFSHNVQEADDQNLSESGTSISLATQRNQDKKESQEASGYNRGSRSYCNQSGPNDKQVKQCEEAVTPDETNQHSHSPPPLECRVNVPKLGSLLTISSNIRSSSCITYQRSEATDRDISHIDNLSWAISMGVSRRHYEELDNREVIRHYNMTISQLDVQPSHVYTHTESENDSSTFIQILIPDHFTCNQNQQLIIEVEGMAEYLVYLIPNTREMWIVLRHGSSGVDFKKLFFDVVVAILNHCINTDEDPVFPENIHPELFFHILYQIAYPICVAAFTTMTSDFICQLKTTLQGIWSEQLRQPPGVCVQTEYHSRLECVLDLLKTRENNPPQAQQTSAKNNKNDAVTSSIASREAEPTVTQPDGSLAMDTANTAQTSASEAESIVTQPDDSVATDTVNSAHHSLSGESDDLIQPRLSSELTDQEEMNDIAMPTVHRGGARPKTKEKFTRRNPTKSQRTRSENQ